MNATILHRTLGAAFRSTFVRRFATDSAWVAIEAVGSRGLALLAMLLAARLLGAKDFGALAAVLGTATFIAGLLADSMRYTAATQIAASAQRGPDARSGVLTLVIWTTVTASAACAVAMFLGAENLARDVLTASSLSGAVRVASLFLLFEALGGLQQGILMGFRHFQSLAWTGLLRGGLLLSMVLLSGERGADLHVLWAFVLAGALAVTVRGFVIARTMRAQKLTAFAPISRAEVAILWRVSLPGLMVSLITLPTNWLGMMLLVRSPRGYAEMGVLGAANQWFSMLLFLPSILTTVTLPALSERYAAGEGASLRRELSITLRASLIAAVPPALLVGVASPWVMRLYGPGFTHGWPTLLVVSLAAVAASTVNMLMIALAVSGRNFLVVVTQLAWAAVYLASAYGLLRLSLGATAIAAAMLAGNVCRLALSAWWARQAVRQIPRGAII